MDIGTMRYYYQTGLWPLERLDKLLQAGKLTEAQYREIVGQADGVTTK